MDFSQGRLGLSTEYLFSLLKRFKSILFRTLVARSLLFEISVPCGSGFTQGDGLKIKEPKKTHPLDQFGTAYQPKTNRRQGESVCPEPEFNQRSTVKPVFLL